jgi:hypothetical protein
MAINNVIEYRIKAIDDGASATFNRVAKNAEGAVRRTTQTYDLGAIRKVDRTAEQQSARDARAEVLRARRERRFDTGADGGISGAGYQRTPAASGPTGIRKIAQQSEDLGKALRLGGALVIADRIGQAMQGIPEALQKYRESLRNGATKTQAAAEAVADIIPGVGSLAKGFRSLKDAADDFFFPERSGAKRKQQEQKDLAETRRKIQEDRDAKRQPIIDRGNEMALDAQRRGRLVGKLGAERETEEAKIGYDEQLRQIADLESKKRTLSLDQQEQLDKQIATMRTTAAAELNDKLDRIRKQDFSRIRAEQVATEQALAAAQAEVRNSQLQLDGRYHTAALEQIRRAGDEEIKALNDQYDQKTALLDENSAEAKFLAEQRDQQIAAIHQRSRQQEAAAETQYQREQQRRQQDHNARMQAAESGLLQRRLQILGRSADAERVAIAEKLRQRLEEIEQQRQLDIQQDAEQTDAINRRARQQAQAAQEEFGVDSEEAQRRQAARFRPSRGGVSFGADNHFLSGAGNQGAANPLIEPSRQTAAAAKKTNEYLKDVASDIAKLLAAVTGGKTPIPLRLY